MSGHAFWLSLLYPFQYSPLPELFHPFLYLLPWHFLHFNFAQNEVVTSSMPVGVSWKCASTISQGTSSQQSTSKDNPFLSHVMLWSFKQYPQIQAHAHSLDPCRHCLAQSCSPCGMVPFLPYQALTSPTGLCCDLTLTSDLGPGEDAGISWRSVLP